MAYHEHEGVWDRFEERRRERGVSQTQLSQMTGISQSMISAIEKEGKWPGRRNLGRIARALACDIGDLVTAHPPIKSQKTIDNSYRTT